MKLYLSSYFFGNRANDLVRMVGPAKSVAIIMNAADQYGDSKRPDYLQNEIEKFKHLGLHAEELDLRDYFETPDLLTNKIHNYGMVWVMGGNSFVLRRALHYSGADKLLSSLVRAGDIVYAGFSAGSVVATPTLRGIELVDDPHVVPEGYKPEIIWEGLNLIDYSIAPHYKSDHPESAAIEKVVTLFQSQSMPYKAISDGEVIVVNGSEQASL